MLAVGGALALATSLATAQSWQTVDDYQYSLRQPAAATGLAKNSLGELFGAGWGRDSTSNYHALVVKSSDAGQSWQNTPTDDFAGDGSLTQPGYDAGITCDSAGTLYAAGNWWPSSGVTQWLVRRGQNSGLNWATVDNFTLGGPTALCQGLATDGSGNVYVVGKADTAADRAVNNWVTRKGVPNGDGTMTWTTVDLVSNGSANAVICHPTAGIFVVGQASVILGRVTVGQWVVRKSIDGGAHWSAVDTYQLDSSLGSSAAGIGIDAAGNVLVVGSGFKTASKTSYSHWIVRKSTNGGAAWFTIDDYQPSSTTSAGALGCAADSQGNLVVIGTFPSTVSHWVVRKSLGGSGPWTTVDNFQYAPGKATDCDSILGDNAGNIFVAGHGTDAAGVYHWLVRKLAP